MTAQQNRAAFVSTGTVLDRILARTAEDVAARKQVMSEAALAASASADGVRDFAGALRRETVALIAEVKHASPSKGVLIEDFDPVALGTTYADNGAAAISVLTDEPFFMGHLDHMREVRGAVSVPVLRKDFTIDPYQVYEGRAAGADAMLLIAAALDDAQMRDLHGLIASLGMAALVEVHNDAELDRALAIGVALIGVNNRDLSTFHEDISTTERLAARIPPNVTLVAESAIRTLADVWRMGDCGARAVLVGEGLVKAGDIARQVREFSSQPREGAR